MFCIQNIKSNQGGEGLGVGGLQPPQIFAVIELLPTDK